MSWIITENFSTFEPFPKYKRFRNFVGCTQLLRQDWKVELNTEQVKKSHVVSHIKALVLKLITLSIYFPLRLGCYFLFMSKLYIVTAILMVGECQRCNKNEATNERWSEEINLLGSPPSCLMSPSDSRLRLPSSSKHPCWDLHL